MRASMIAAALTLCAIVHAFAVPQSRVIAGGGIADLGSSVTGYLDLWAAFSPTTKYLSKFNFLTPNPLGGHSVFRGSRLVGSQVIGPYPLIVDLMFYGTWNGTPAYCELVVVDDLARPGVAGRQPDHHHEGVRS